MFTKRSIYSVRWEGKASVFLRPFDGDTPTEFNNVDENKREILGVREILARLCRQSGSKSDVTRSLEGIGVTEAGRPRGSVSSHRRQRGLWLRAQPPATPALIQPSNLLLSSRRTSSTTVG